MDNMAQCKVLYVCMYGISSGGKVSHVDPSDEMELRLPVPSVESLELCFTSNRLGPVPFPSTFPSKLEYRVIVFYSRRRQMAKNMNGHT